MPKLSKYKAAGRTASSYQKSIGDVNKLGLGLQNAQWKGEEQRSLYGAIGATTANILGIVKEKKMLGELNKLKESASNLPGIIKESRKVQRGGKIGEILGLDMRDEDVYKSAFTGEELSDSMLRGIGQGEQLSPGSTSYNDYDALLKNDEGNYTNILNKGSRYSPEAANLATEKAYAQVGATSQEEYDKYYDDEFEDSPKTVQNNVNPVVADNNDNSNFQDATNTNDSPKSIKNNVQPTIGEMVVDSVVTGGKFPDFANIDDTRQSPKGPVIDFKNASAPDTFSKGQKDAWQSIGNVGGSFAKRVAHLESSLGQNTGKRGDAFQYGGENKNWTLEEQTNYFLKENKQRTKNYGKDGYYEMGKNLGMDKDLVNYVAHQQGGMGARDIISATKSGVFKKGNEDERISNMLGNLHDRDKSDMIAKYGKGAPGIRIGGMSKSDIQSFSSDFLNLQKSYWGN